MNALLNKEDINSNELQSLLEAREKGEVEFVLVDVREDFEVEESYIKGMDINLPTSSFDITKIEEYKTKNIILYCRSGARTTQVKTYLQNNGFSKVSHLQNGISQYFGVKN